MNLIHVLNCRSVEMNLKKVFFKQRATGWPDVLMGPVLNGLARPVNRPTDRAWACKQTRCPIGARPGGTPCQSGPCPYGPCLARARAGPCRAGPLLNFRRARSHPVPAERDPSPSLCRPAVHGLQRATRRMSGQAYGVRSLSRAAAPATSGLRPAGDTSIQRGSTCMHDDARGARRVQVSSPLPTATAGLRVVSRR